MVALNDYYATLGVAPNATQTQIKRAFRTESRKWHPDVNPAQNATERMQQINEAYFVLSKPDVRARYDAACRPIRRQQPANTTSQYTKREFNPDPILEKNVREAKAKAADPSNWAKDTVVGLGALVGGFVAILLSWLAIQVVLHGVSSVGIDPGLFIMLATFVFIVVIFKYC